MFGPTAGYIIPRNIGYGKGRQRHLRHANLTLAPSTRDTADFLWKGFSVAPSFIKLASALPLRAELWLFPTCGAGIIYSPCIVCKMCRWNWTTPPQTFGGCTQSGRISCGSGRTLSTACAAETRKSMPLVRNTPRPGKCERAESKHWHRTQRGSRCKKTTTKRYVCRPYESSILSLCIVPKLAATSIAPSRFCTTYRCAFERSEEADEGPIGEKKNRYSHTTLV